MIDRTPHGTATAQRVTSAIAKASARTGVSFDYLMDQARIESGMRPDARASTSSATGLFQFTRQTWLETVKQHGAAHGLGWAADAISANRDGTFSVTERAMRTAIYDLRTNPEAAAAMAAEFASDNSAHLQARFGTNPEPVDLYLAHFLGADGAARFLDAYRDDPEQSAAALFPAAARANRTVFYRDVGVARSLSDIREHFAAKLRNPPKGDRAVANVDRQRTDLAKHQRAPLHMAKIEPMPKSLDLDFARNTYRRLSGLSV
jgi:Transglycosylase SLT domain